MNLKTKILKSKSILYEVYYGHRKKTIGKFIFRSMRKLVLSISLSLEKGVGKNPFKMCILVNRFYVHYSYQFKN